MRIGGRVEAKGGEVRDIFMMVAVPLDCPEQKVKVVEEEFPAELGTVEFRTLPDVEAAEPGAKQMLISDSATAVAANRRRRGDLRDRHQAGVMAPTGNGDASHPRQSVARLEDRSSRPARLSTSNDRKITTRWKRRSNCESKTTKRGRLPPL